MLHFLLPILGLGCLCGAWVVVQRWVGKHDPGQPGVEGKCGRCTHHHDSHHAHTPTITREPRRS